MSLPPEIEEIIQEYRQLTFRARKNEMVITRQLDNAEAKYLSEKFIIKPGLWCVTQSPYQRVRTVLVSTLILHHSSVDISNISHIKVPYSFPHRSSILYRPSILFRGAFPDLTIISNDKPILSFNPSLPEAKYRIDRNIVPYGIGAEICNAIHGNDSIIIFTLGYHGLLSRYGLFSGMIFLVSGRMSVSQETMRDTLITNGGLVAGTANAPDLTHLVASTLDSAKAKTATSRGIPIMTEEWVRDCIAADRLVFEDRHYLSNSLKAKPRLRLG